MAFDGEPWGEKPILPRCPGCGKVIKPHENVTIIHSGHPAFGYISSVKWHSSCSEHIWMPKWPLLDWHG